MDKLPLILGLDPRAGGYAATDVEGLCRVIMTSVLKGSRPITLTALTVPNYRKTGFPYRDNLQKISRVNGNLNFDYQAAVNRQRDREGVIAQAFDAGPRQWGTKMEIPGTPFISHVNKVGAHKLYLRFKVHKSLDYHYLDLDGNILPAEQINPFIVQSSVPKQKVENEVKERDYYFGNILTMVIDGQGYLLQHGE